MTRASPENCATRKLGYGRSERAGAEICGGTILRLFALRSPRALPGLERRGLRRHSWAHVWAQRYDVKLA